MIDLTRETMIRATDIASKECDKNLRWTGLDCEAEKYLAPLRHALGVSQDRFPWCACFVAWCIREAGGVIPDEWPGFTFQTIAYVPTWEMWARQAGFWYQRTSLNKFMPQKGDIVLFDWDGRNVPEDDNHIGIVETYPGEDIVHTCEGNTSAENQGNGNTTAHKLRGFKIIHGFIRF
jgi:hypothetical protein